MIRYFLSFIISLSISACFTYGQLSPKKVVTYVEEAPCKITSIDEGYEISCSNSEPFILYHGQDGNDAELDLQVIDPCGDDPNITFEEVLLKFDDETIIAYFQSGSKKFLAQLIPGTYVTTDAQKCKFKVTDEYEIVEL